MNEIDIPAGVYRGDSTCRHYEGPENVYIRECCGGRKHVCLKIICGKKGTVDPDIVSCQIGLCGDYEAKFCL